MNLTNIILFAGNNAQQGNGSWSSTLIFFALIIFIFYFFLIRPQTKKEKEAKKFRDSLQKGNKVVTIGGLHGKISSIQDTTVCLEIEDGGKIVVEKSAIAQFETSEKKEN
ncbi:MAG: preprotein translocase subunit YajC [Bacteroidales bacterium]|nr:preprotein translocase subunit YajC [Bacteroidales bacterium]